MKSIKSIAEFNTLLASETAVLADFYADWCGPCQMLLPTIEELAKEYEGKVEVVKINVDENRELAVRYQVRSIPALFFFNNGDEVNRLHGMQHVATLREHLDKLTLADVTS